MSISFPRTRLLAGEGLGIMQVGLALIRTSNMGGIGRNRNPLFQLPNVRFAQHL